MSVEDFHIRMHHDLDRQVEKEAIVRRTSKNQLIIGLVHRGLNPNPDDEKTVFRRLDRVEKSIDALEKAVRALVQQIKTSASESAVAVQGVQQHVQEVVAEHRLMHAAVLQTAAQIEHIVSTLLPKTQEQHVELLREVLQTIGQENPRALRSLYQRLTNT